MSESSLVVEICGEGGTDVGPIGPPGKPGRAAVLPSEGVLPVLVHKLCGEPTTMRTITRALPFLVGKGLWQKVKFAKQTALYNKSAGAVFVMDSEGNHRRRLAELHKGRDSAYSEFPMAVGVAHPCIETWLLASPDSIVTALALPNRPEVPQDPESLPAPCVNRDHSPKTILAKCAGRSAIASRDATRIAAAVDLPSLRQRCPIGFAPFAEEVEERIRPLFT
jgi:hypothetical protein